MVLLKYYWFLKNLTSLTWLWWNKTDVNWFIIALVGIEPFTLYYNLCSLIMMISCFFFRDQILNMWMKQSTLRSHLLLSNLAHRQKFVVFSTNICTYWPTDHATSIHALWLVLMTWLRWIKKKVIQYGVD